MTEVLAVLYSLIVGMGLVGASYSEIEQAFPDNTAAQNQVLYSVANNPTMGTNGFNVSWNPHYAEIALFLNGSAWASASWDALMQEVGFAVVENNIQNAVDNGYTASGVEFTGTLQYGDDTLIVSYYGSTRTAFRSVDRIPDGVVIWQGLPTVNQGGYIPVWRWVYGDQTIYSTSVHENTGNYIFINHDLYARFEIINNQLHWRVFRRSNNQVYSDTIFYPQYWINQGFLIDSSLPFEPVASESVGEEYLSFGDVDNPVVDVSYDSATGTTTYIYKDGTTTTTIPQTIGDSIVLTPDITQPLTQYIINEGDITNIYNPDSAIPSDSAVPFDFEALGQLFDRTFTPTLKPDPTPMLNRFKSKYDWENAFKKVANKFNISPRRPSYPVYIGFFDRTIDFWDWCDVLLTDRNYQTYLKFIKFFLYIGMISSCFAIFMRSIHVSFGTVSFDRGDS